MACTFEKKLIGGGGGRGGDKHPHEQRTEEGNLEKKVQAIFLEHFEGWYNNQ